MTVARPFGRDCNTFLAIKFRNSWLPSILIDLINAAQTGQIDQGKELLRLTANMVRCCSALIQAVARCHDGIQEAYNCTAASEQGKNTARDRPKRVFGGGSCIDGPRVRKRDEGLAGPTE